jgi:hypothetical protein
VVASKKSKGLEMKNILSLTTILIATTYASSVCADDSLYLGVLYNAQKVSSYDRDYNAVGVIAGYQYNDFLAIETRLSKGTSGYSDSYSKQLAGSSNILQDSYFKEEIDLQASLLIKASYPIFESFKLYGLAGLTKTKFAISGYVQNFELNGALTGGRYTYKPSKTESDFSYGLGLNYQLKEQFNIFIDYVVLPNVEINPNNSKSWNITTIGVSYYF